MPLTIRTDPMTCAECGAAIDMGHVIVIQGLVLCPEDSARRAIDILSSRSEDTTFAEVERAVSALDVATRMLRVERLRGMGRRS